MPFSVLYFPSSSGPSESVRICTQEFLEKSGAISFPLITPLHDTLLIVQLPMRTARNTTAHFTTFLDIACRREFPRILRDFVEPPIIGSRAPGHSHALSAILMHSRPFSCPLGHSHSAVPRRVLVTDIFVIIIKGQKNMFCSDTLILVGL